MAKEIDLDYALSETLKEHPDFAPYISNIIYKNIYSGTNSHNFTSSVREYISTAKQVDFIEYILEEAIKLYTGAEELLEDDLSEMEIKNLSKHFVKMPVITKAMDILRNKENNTILYYLYNRNELFELIDAVCKTIFKKKWYSEVGINSDTRNRFHALIEKASKIIKNLVH